MMKLRLNVQEKFQTRKKGKRLKRRCETINNAKNEDITCKAYLPDLILQLTMGVSVSVILRV